MSKMSITLQPEIDNRGIDQVRKAIKQMNPGDEISINIEAADAHQADDIISLLQANAFDYQPRGTNDGQSYFINARKRSN